MAGDYRRIDAHSHPEGPKTAYGEAMKQAGFAGALALSWSGFRELDELEAYEHAMLDGTDNLPISIRFAAAFPIRAYREPGYADAVSAKLDRDIAQRGAVAVKVWKDLGMMLTDDQGRYVHCDDPAFRPIFDAIEARGLVICMHLGDPKAAWLPLDDNSPHVGYYRHHPEFHWYGQADKPSHEELMQHRDALVARHPKARFVAAHLASLEHDVDEVAAFLDRFPNAWVDTAARVSDLRFQPREKVRNFFLQYADRILYGSDWECDGASFASDETTRAEAIARRVAQFRADFALFEETLALPHDVLEKFYYGNAAKLYGFQAAA